MFFDMVNTAESSFEIPFLQRELYVDPTCLLQIFAYVFMWSEEDKMSLESEWPIRISSILVLTSSSESESSESSGSDPSEFESSEVNFLHSMVFRSWPPSESGSLSFSFRCSSSVLEMTLYQNF